MTDQTVSKSASVRSKGSRRLLLVAALAVILALPLWYMGVIISAKFELGGYHPHRQTLGHLGFIGQRAMEPFCTGVVVTPQSTWLVGRREHDDPAQPADAINLSSLLNDKSAGTPNADKSAYGSLLGAAEPVTSYISRLDEHGQFHLVATVGEVVCLQPTPDGRSVYLLTGLDRPHKEENPGDPIPQTVVFRSDDQGKSWVWQREGLMKQANSLAWSLQLYFHGEREVWATTVQRDSTPAAYNSDAGSDAGALFYSSDGGLTSERLPIDSSLLVKFSQVKGKAPANTTWGDDAGGDSVSPSGVSVVQLDAERAVLWVSQSFRYSPIDGKFFSGSIEMTSYAPLRRVDGHWQMGQVQRLEDTAIDEVLQNQDGRIIALISHSNTVRQQIAELDPATLAWKPQGELPTPFGMLTSSTYLRGLWIGKGALVANVSASHQVPRWLYPWSEDAAEISADGVFYSTNGGHSWRRLGVDGYLGVLGVDPASDRIFWADGNWYDSTDLGVYSYGLRDE